MKLKVIITMILIVSAITVVFAVIQSRAQSHASLGLSSNAGIAKNEDYEQCDFTDLDDIVGFRFDGSINCDLDGDGKIEMVTLFTGQNQNDEYGWDLGVGVRIKEKKHQVWLNTVGSSRSSMLFEFANGCQGVLLVVSGNVGDTLYLINFEDGELKARLILGNR